MDYLNVIKRSEFKHNKFKPTLLMMSDTNTTVVWVLLTFGLACYNAEVSLMESPSLNVIEDVGSIFNIV